MATELARYGPGGTDHEFQRMEKYNPNHCIDNIYKLARRNGVLIKDLEKKSV